MKRFLLYLPALLVALLNLALVTYCYWHLPAELPLHFDLEGNYTSTMPSWMLFLYPVIAVGLGVVIYLFSSIVMSHSTKRRDSNWEQGMAALAFCISLTVLSSTCVTLTAGTKHLFMFAEPVLLLIGMACAALAEIRIR